MPVSYSKDITLLESSLGYQFRDKKLLIVALTHKSYHHENPHSAVKHNERMEFLGDSVLGSVIAETLFNADSIYEKCPCLTEADMSKIKSYLVKESVLSEVASALSLGDYIRLGKGEESTGGRLKKSILSDTVEALFGAVFLDSDYETVKSVILKLYNAKVASAISNKEGYDFKSEFQEKCQNIFGSLPEYSIIKQEGADHKKVFTAEVRVNEILYGTGAGKSKKDAQMNAAKEAIDKLTLICTNNM